MNASSIPSRMLTFPVVCINFTAVTPLTVWLFVVKWREMGFITFPCLMSVRCALKRSLKVFPDCTTYCRPHLEQETRYITFLDLQL